MSRIEFPFLSLTNCPSEVIRTAPLATSASTISRYPFSQAINKAVLPSYITLTHMTWKYVVNEEIKWMVVSTEGVFYIEEEKAFDYKGNLMNRIEEKILKLLPYRKNKYLKFQKILAMKLNKSR